MHKIIYQILARKPATSMPPIRPENHKQKESPPSESQGARGNGNRRMSEDNAKEEQGLQFTFVEIPLQSDPSFR